MQDGAENAAEWTVAEGRALHERLRASGQTVAAAESLTVGRVQAELGRWSGSSRYFLGGLCAYTLAGKVRWLGVEAEVAATCDGVSAEVAQAMAAGAARFFGADWALATTGYAEPDAAKGISVPHAWVAVCGPGARGMQRVRRVEGPGLSREAMQGRAAAAALRLLAEALEVAAAAEAMSRS
jgi:PncC family amidohydrolase